MGALDDQLDARDSTPVTSTGSKEQQHLPPLFTTPSPVVQHAKIDDRRVAIEKRIAQLIAIKSDHS